MEIKFTITHEGKEARVKMIDPDLITMVAQLHKAMTEVEALVTEERNVYGKNVWTCLVDCPSCKSAYDWAIKNAKYPHICRECKQPLYVKEVERYGGKKNYEGPIYEAVTKFGK